MKRTLTLITSVAMLVAGIASAEPSGDPFEGKLRPIRPDQTMSTDEVTTYALRYHPRIARCYKVHADKRAGELRLYLVIARNGRVVHVDIDAPVLRRMPLERCVRNEVRTWRFPQRTGFTNVTIPYAFR